MDSSSGWGLDEGEEDNENKNKNKNEDDEDKIGVVGFSSKWGCVYLNPHKITPNSLETVPTNCLRE